MNYYGIEFMAKERQGQLLDEAAHDRLTREVTRKTKGPARDHSTRPRNEVGVGALYVRFRTFLVGNPRPTITREPAG